MTTVPGAQGPRAKEAWGGREWFTEMVGAMDYVKEKEDRGLMKVMSYQDMCKLYVPDFSFA